MSTNSREVANSILAVIGSLGCSMAPGMRVLDFGCGRGRLVSTLGEMGYDAYGADVRRCWEGSNDETRLRVISQAPYRLPFEENRFDLVTSTSVFEHVQNPEECLREIYRVLKPGGSTIHLFPGPWYLPFEPHTGIPLGGVAHSQSWVALWAWLGVRNKHQQGMDWKSVLDSDLDYFRTGLNYMPRGKVKELVNEIFGNCTFAKSEYVKFWHGSAAKLGRRFPISGYASLLFAFHDGLVFARRPLEQ